MVRDYIKKQIEFELKKYGFEGTGLTYGKAVDEHYTFCLIIQFNKFGTSFCAEMGVYIDLGHYRGNQSVSTKNISAYDCIFRKRLSPTDDSDFWWNYGNTEEAAGECIRYFRATFESSGLSFFNQFQGFPRPFDKLTYEDICKGNLAFRSLGENLGLHAISTVARIKLHCGYKKDALEICRFGLNSTRDKTPYKEVFEDLVKAAEDIV